MYGGSGKLLGVQVFGALIIVCWSALVNLPLFFLLRHFKVLRIPLDAQLSVHVRSSSHLFCCVMLRNSLQYMVFPRSAFSMKLSLCTQLSVFCLYSMLVFFCDSVFVPPQGV